MEAKNDHLLRLKTSNNPGRLFVYAMFHVPVVTDATPSTCEIIRDYYNGRVVLTKEGWYAAIKELIDNVKKREEYGNNLNKTITTHYDIELTFDRFIEFLKSPPLGLVKIKSEKVSFKIHLFYKFIRKLKKLF